MPKVQQVTANSTQDFVEVADVRESVVVLKNGSLRSIVEVGSMNFELKSQDERVAIVMAFQEFLNSIDFSLQIVVNSRKLNIAPYLVYLDSLTQNIEHELLKIQATEYSRFVKGLTELANIMSKKFYVVVPFVPSAIGAASQKSGGIFEGIKNIIRPPRMLATLSEEEFQTYKTQIDQRVDLVISGISRLGIQARPLEKEGLTNLFQALYNPGGQPIATASPSN